MKLYLGNLDNFMDVNEQDNNMGPGDMNSKIEADVNEMFPE